MRAKIGDVVIDKTYHKDGRLSIVVGEGISQPILLRHRSGITMDKLGDVFSTWEGLEVIGHINFEKIWAEAVRIADRKTEQSKDAVSREWLLNEFVAHAYDIIYDINSHEKGMSLTGIKQVIESAPPVAVEPCEDAISREYALGVIYPSDIYPSRADIYKALKDAPSVTVEPKQGEWNPYYTKRKYNDTFNCKLCGDTFIVIQGKEDMNFCPNCGAKMKGADDE